MDSDFMFFLRWGAHLLKWTLFIPVAWLLYPIYRNEIDSMKLRLFRENILWERERAGTVLTSESGMAPVVPRVTHISRKENESKEQIVYSN